MRLIIGGMLAALILTGCSSEPKAGPGPQAAALDTEKSQDMCEVLPGPDAAKAIGVPSLNAKTDLAGGCLYTGLPGCEQQPEDDCEILVQFSQRKVDMGETKAEIVPGIGEKAYYIGMGTVIAQIGANGKLLVSVPLPAAPGDEAKLKRYSVDMAKAIAAKL
jgi:hypothetical protein